MASSGPSVGNEGHSLNANEVPRSFSRRKCARTRSPGVLGARRRRAGCDLTAPCSVLLEGLAVSFRSVFIAVVIGTALLVGAFMLNWYRPRIVTEQPTAELVRASGKCAECHANLQY